MHCIIVVLMLVFGVLAARPATADQVVIEQALSETIKLYESPDGKGGSSARFSKEEVDHAISNAGGNLKAVREGLMLNVTIDGQEGWIEARTVKLKETFGKLTIRCAQASAPPSVAATRGIEDQVECAK